MRDNKQDALNKRTILEKSKVRFQDIFNISEIQQLQDSFCQATGVASVITDVDGIPLTTPTNFCCLCNLIRKTKRGLANCMKSDAVIGAPNLEGPTVRQCLSGGLWDAGASIFVGDRHIANWLIGQVRNEDIDVDQILEYADYIGADKKTFMEAFQQVTVMSVEQFKEIANMLYLMANMMSKIAYHNLQQSTYIKEKKKILLENEQLIDELQSKNIELERFTYTVSHDLKSPLVTIEGYTDILNNPHENKEIIKHAIDRINTAVEKMKDLLDDLLDLSKIGRMTNPLKTLSMNEIVDESLKLLEGRIKKAGAEIVVEPELPHYKCDKQRMLQVIQNFIENALKYKKDDQPVCINIGTKRVDGKNVCYLKDNGIGIAPEYQDKVFDIFYKLDSSTDGSGIGLAYVKRIIEVQGGKIWVESDGLGHGTTFLFYL